MTSDEYAIGYKKPPKEHQFKAGESGNPKGRPKGRKNFKTELAEELSESIEIVEGGRKRVVSKQSALIKRLVQMGLEADLRALNSISTLAVKYLEDEQASDSDLPTEADHEILDAYFAKRAAAAKNKRRKK